MGKYRLEGIKIVAIIVLIYVVLTGILTILGVKI